MEGVGHFPSLILIHPVRICQVQFEFIKVSISQIEKLLHGSYVLTGTKGYFTVYTFIHLPPLPPTYKHLAFVLAPLANTFEDKTTGSYVQLPHQNKKALAITLSSLQHLVHPVLLKRCTHQHKHSLGNIVTCRNTHLATCVRWVCRHVSNLICKDKQAIENICRRLSMGTPYTSIYRQDSKNTTAQSPC